MRYIDESECPQCDDYVRPFGCTNHGCPIYKDYEEGRAEMAADFEHDKRKEDRLDPVFKEIFEAQGIMKGEDEEWTT